MLEERDDDAGRCLPEPNYVAIRRCHEPAIRREGHIEYLGRLIHPRHLPAGGRVPDLSRSIPPPTDDPFAIRRECHGTDPSAVLDTGEFLTCRGFPHSRAAKST